MRKILTFLMYDWLDVASLIQRERFREHSKETYEAVLDTSERIAREKFAPFNRLVDSQEPIFDGERVHLPEATRAATAAYTASGLLTAGHDYVVGGMQLPYVVDMAANGFFSQASIGMAGYSMLTYANSNLLMAHGTAAQKSAFAQPQIDGRFMGTMCLSEPQAGSSLGDIVTRAVADGVDFENDPLGPRYRLKGNKMWISGGEHELSENIIHLVLAKIPAANGQMPNGVKGLSLFIVPRFLVDEKGQLTGQRNDVALAGLNHKMGYRAITNTLLNFGEGRFPISGNGSPDGSGAVGYLVGTPGQGLSNMFHMMNEARINVGMGAAMLGYAGFLTSLDYARGRPQGRPTGPDRKDSAAAQVPIIQHTDVKRMLLAQKTYCQGALAFCLYCARLVDEKRTGDAHSAAEAAALLDLLTPLAKSWPSEWCLEANNLAIQVLGGCGYTRDFPVEQLWRDNRLNLIHEGTHGIQGLDLLGRKVLANNGYALKLWSSKVSETCARAQCKVLLAHHAFSLNAALEHLLRTTEEAWSTGNPEEALGNATAYLQSFGHIALAWTWLAVALAASEKLVTETVPDESFLRGLLQATQYFFDYELPKINAWLAPVSSLDTTCRDMLDEWM